MATISTKPNTTTSASSLDINSFSEAEKLAILSIFGNLRLTAGSPVRSIVKRLEEHFTDADFEQAFEEFEIDVYMDGIKLDPGFLEIEVSST